MRFIKKIDIFVFKAYSLLFVGTFFICLFVFMMQFMWRYVDELIGKGLTLDVLARFFYYASLTLIPISLPLAILLASLITFGNFGERFELLSMKAAGISLIRILRPIFIFTIALGIGSFYFQNVTSPEATKKLGTLVYSMKQKSPELEIPEGVFYSDIPGFNIFVEKKNKKNGMLYGVMIYSTTDGYEDAQIVLADSASLQTTADKHYLQLTMYAGERFRNMQAQGGMMSRSNVPYMRETFIKEIDLIEFDANFNMMDASLFSGNAQTKTLAEIKTDIDSLTQKSDSTGRALFSATRRTHYARDLKADDKDSVRIAQQIKETVSIDSVFARLSASQRQSATQTAMFKSKNLTSDYEFRGLIAGDTEKATRMHWVEWHKKFTLSLACIFFFFIGAPLGAIIRKGGLGVPVVVSVAIFIFYYIVNVSGEKMAKSGEWIVWFGVWLSSMVLCPIGLFLTYKANKDSVVFNMEAYVNILRRILGLRLSRHIARKEVVIHDPDYPSVKEELFELSESWKQYAQDNRLRIPPSYLRLFFKNQDDQTAVHLHQRLETIIGILSNSKDLAILDSLNRIPVISPGPTVIRFITINGISSSGHSFPWACFSISAFGCIAYVCIRISSKYKNTVRSSLNA